MKEETFLRCANVISQESHCVSEKVGCLIVLDDRIVSVGYNGTPSGYINCEDMFSSAGKAHSKWSQKFEIHAEMNALLYAAKNGISVDGATLYSTLQPCWQCSKNLIQAGVQKVVFSEKYDRLDSKEERLNEFLKENGVSIKHVPLEF